MRYFVPLVLACMLSAVSAASAAPKADFFAAPNGNDSWSGRLDAPARNGGDGPFATLQRAQKAVRQLKQSQSGRAITVMVRSGTYYLQEPITFTPEDSGTDKAPITYAAYPGEKPVFSGGARLTGWEKADGGRWQLRIPDVASGKWNFNQLFVNGERRFRPRLPKIGYYNIASTLPATNAAKDPRQDRFRFNQGEIKSDWSNLRDVEVFGFQNWTMARARIAAVDEANRIVNFTGPIGYDSPWSGFPTGNRFLIDNVKEALDEPGEWYLDRKTGVLTYLPLRGERIGKVEVVAPKIDRLIVLTGDVGKRQWVQNLVFRGLSLMYTNWNTPDEGYNCGQAEVVIGGAFTAEGARWCKLEKCTIARIGTYAVEWGAACQNNRVEDCELVDMGAGGVKIGEPGIQEDPELLTSHNTIYNNRIAHGGRLQPAGIGVWIGQSPYNVVDHNDIYDLYYSGMSIGWTWGYTASAENHTLITNNHIWNIGQGVLSDMGGTYHLGNAPGTVERHNLIHDVESYGYGGWGIYLDEGSTDVLVEDNVVYRCKTGAFHQHYGKENILRNNIWALAWADGQIVRTRMEPHLSFTFDHNIVYWNDAPLLGTNWSDNNYKMDYNLYWSTSRKPISFAGKTLKEWQAKGQDVHSIVADPMFVDPAKGDFRLKPGSPAEKIGFKPISMTGFGREGKHSPDTGKWPRIYPKPMATAPNVAISDNFEYGSIGLKPAGATVTEENDRATLRTTDETSVSGKYSIKFTDMPGQQYSFNPHMFYSTNFTSGLVKGSFELRMEPDAIFYHEWRDSGSPYHPGPSLRVSGNGTLSIGGKDVGRIPLSQWVKFEITCPLGSKAGKYDLAVSVPGESSPRQFKGLSCDPGFKTLNWYGFVSDGAMSAVFYIDDVDLKKVSD